MSRVFQSDKEAKDDQKTASSPSQQYWDTMVPELTCEESLDDDLPASELAMEPSLSQDLDMKGIMSRKGKGGTFKGKPRAPTLKCGKGRGDDIRAAKKEPGKVPKKAYVAMMASGKDELGGEKSEEKNKQQLQAEPIVEEEETEGHVEHGDDKDLGYHA